MILYHRPESDDRCPPPWLSSGGASAQGPRGLFWTRSSEGQLLQWPGDAGWLPVEDGWHCRLVGELQIDSLLREWLELDDGSRRLRLADGTSALCYPAHDGQARIWWAPVILDLQGDPALSMPWGRDADGQAARVPTPLQRSLIDAVGKARAEILGQRLAELPVPVAFEWCARILEAAYHLSAGTVLALQLLDDYLACRLLTGAIGMGTPEMPLQPDEAVA